MWKCILFMCLVLQRCVEPVTSSQSNNYNFHEPKPTSSSRIRIPADAANLPNRDLMQMLADGNFKLKKLHADSNEQENVGEDFEKQEFLKAVRSSLFEPLVENIKRDAESRRIVPGWPSTFPKDKNAYKLS